MSTLAVKNMQLSQTKVHFLNSSVKNMQLSFVKMHFNDGSKRRSIQPKRKQQAGMRHCNWGDNR